MSYRNTLINTWKTVAYSQIVIITIALLFLWKVGWRSAIGGFVVGELIHLKWWFDLKQRMLGRLREKSELYQTSPQEFPALDLKEWNQYTETLENLGFKQIIDFKVESTSGIGRLFSDSQNHVFAEIFKIFSPNLAPKPVAYSFHSILSNEWVFSSTSSKPNGLSYMWRNPKKITTYHSETSASELLKLHLKRRSQIIEDLGLTILTDISWKTYCENQDASSRSRKSNFRRKNILFALIEATLFELKPKTEWLGDYPKLAAQRKARGL